MKARFLVSEVRDKKVHISVGIVTYNSSNDIAKCLTTLGKFMPEKYALDVYVFDNKSPDSAGTQKIIQKNFPKVNLIVSADNRGFGYGHNQIINKVTSDYHLILNADIEFEMDVMSDMVSYLEKNSDTALVTPEIRNLDGTVQHLPKEFPKIKYVLSSTIPFFAKYRGDYTRSHTIITKPAEMHISTGCFMLVRTAQLKKVGGFDDGYFLYFEDFDLSMRLRKLGKLIYYPLVYVIHFWHRDSKKSKRLFVIQIQSMLRFYKKWILEKR